MDRAAEFRRLFADMVGRHGEDVDLARSALYIAGEDSDGVDVAACLAVLDGMALEFGQRIGLDTDLRTQVQRLGQYLSGEQHFRGDTDDYYNPQNCYLHRVLERRRGIPITLALVYMEVGARVGMVLEAIGLPGHLVIRLGRPEDELYVDPFNQGRLLSKADCQRLVEEISHGSLKFREEFLLPHSKKQLLIRVLSNLKHNYARLGDFERALAAADRTALIDPRLGANLKERAWLYQQTGKYRLAIRDLESYLKLTPQPQDAEEVKRQVQALWATMAALN